jgi:arsenate reductase
MYPELTNTIQQLQHQSISEERKITLQSLIDFVQQKTDEGKDINCNSHDFI